MRQFKQYGDLKEEIIRLHIYGVSSRKICKHLGLNPNKKADINYIIKQWKQGEIVVDVGAKVLVLDIETSPNRFWGWGMFNQNFGLNQIDSEWFVMSYCAKWLGSPDCFYEDMQGKVESEDDSELLEGIWNLVNEADVVIGQNSKKFDMKKLNARWIMNGFAPPSPYKQIDTLDIAKRLFGFTSKKLEWMTDKLCSRKKLKHGKFPGFELWKECLADNPTAWAEMKEYNIEDVYSTEELYRVMAPWDNKHVNFNLYKDGNTESCHCGCSTVVPDGFAYTGVSKFQRYRCTNCGATSRGRINLFSKEKRKSLRMNIA